MAQCKGLSTSEQSFNPSLPIDSILGLLLPAELDATHKGGLRSVCPMQQIICSLSLIQKPCKDQLVAIDRPESEQSMHPSCIGSPVAWLRVQDCRFSAFTELYVFSVVHLDRHHVDSNQSCAAITSDTVNVREI